MTYAKKKKDAGSILTNDSSLYNFAYYFLLPIVKHKPAQKEMMDFLEEVFGVSTRTIRKYKCVKPFRQKCRTYVTATKAMNTDFGLKGNVGDLFYVRFDMKYPDRIDVEVTNKAVWPTCFQLTRAEWRDTLKCLRYCETPPPSRPKHSWY